MAQRVERLAANPHSLSLILGTYMVDGRTSSHKLFSDPYACTPTHTHKNKLINLNDLKGN